MVLVLHSKVTLARGWNQWFAPDGAVVASFAATTLQS